jgi:hypothetical protein
VSLPPESLEVGKCYLTNTGQVRRVLVMLPGRVQFERRVKTRGLKLGWIRDIAETRAFASSVEREVPCDWTPEREA